MMTRFHVKNYKCLADVALDLTPLHVIIGQNDSGKTSLLEAMKALHQSARDDLSVAFLGPWYGTELVFDGASSPRVEFHARFEDHLGDATKAIDYHLSLEFLQRMWGVRVADESIGGEEVPINQDEMFNRTSLFSSRFSGVTDELKDKLNDLFEMMGVARIYRLDPKTMAIPAALDASRKFRLDEDGFGLATLLDDILGDDPQEYLAIRDEFCRYFPQFKDVRLATDIATARGYSDSRLRITSEGTGKGIYFEMVGGKTIHAEQASDGAILFLGFLALMSTPHPPTLLLLEEPEKGIYPKRLAEVIEVIRTMRRRPADRPVPQIILTTHSPYLLSAFSPEEVTLLSRENGTGPVRARALRDAPHIHERLADDQFYLGELWYNLSEDELFADA